MGQTEDLRYVVSVNQVFGVNGGHDEGSLKVSTASVYCVSLKV